LIIFLFQAGVEIRPSVLGKITTVAQLGTIFMVLVNHDLGWFSRILPFLYITTALITVISGLHYMYLGTKLMGPDENS
jgi:cardiolipin synthase